MSIYIPEKDWFKAPEGVERAWVGIALIWCIIMFVMMPYWHFKGKQNATGEAYRVAPADFISRVDKFVDSYKIGEENGIPIVAPPPGTDIYLLGRMWQWYPIIKLKKGMEYRLHISSADLQHGFSVLPININFQILPGYDYMLTITPTLEGEYSIICNEFCGIGHHLMTGKFIVE